MSKTLIIAEKPSVAADIARSLGDFTKHQDYFENDEYVLSSAVGHLLELRAPEAFDVKRGKWTFTHLPVIPPNFDLAPIARSEARLKVLLRLIKRKDVGDLINACDAGREGELIFRYIVQAAKARQPVRRLWLQSMTPAAIREAFERLRSDDEMMPLADAARSRSEADWLVGINGTRAMTAFNSKEGGFYLTTVGRVQTPTLAIVVEREDKIRRFVARDYWEVRATFGATAGPYDGRWFDPKFKKSDDVDARAERIWDEKSALQIADACRGKTGTATEEAKPSTQLAPLLFDLTSLQREANSKFGFSAKTTLSIAQALYERHKVLTYPRTDSRALPEDYVATVRKTMDVLSGVGPYRDFAKKINKQGWVKPNKRVFDNAKVSDHFAIIPTLQTPKQLSEIETKLYDLVVKRFLSIFYPAAEYLVTTRITEVEGHSFKTEGKVLVEPGWLAIYGREAVEEQGSLPKIEQGERVQASEVQSVALATRPPARYTEATLLSAMEGAGKLMEDDDLRAAMVGKGLGTPATRSTIIEGLIDQRYMVRDGKDLRPTRKAFDLITLLKGLDIEELTAPELTGEWEHKLSLMEHGQLKRDLFMREIAAMTKKVVDRAKSYQSTTVPIEDPATLATPCPNCGKKIVENYRRYACTNCEFSLPKHPGSRTFEVEEVEQLLRDRTIGPLQGFISKMGRPFAAVLKITPELKVEFDFGQSNEGEGGAPIDFSGLSPMGPCPKCAGNVFEQPMSYLCENSVGAEKKCDFRSGKVILQQPIETTQMTKLLVDGRTDLLRGFVSNRTRRKFSAFLVRKPDGTTGFEFEARPAKAAKSSKPGALVAAEPDAKVNGGAYEAPPARTPAKRTPRSSGVKSAAPAKKAAGASRKRVASVVSGVAPRTPAAKAARAAGARKAATRR
ncbi:MAG: DNA topoisomerase III [Burkholderiaceae bacterium]|nr:DNA topoisomerase III [Burkholderiaceae bacterium]